jgi:hypothetical protein
VTKNSVGEEGVSYTYARKKVSGMPLACILLRKNFWNGILACSITNIPLLHIHVILCVQEETQHMESTDFREIVSGCHYVPHVNVGLCEEFRYGTLKSVTVGMTFGGRIV